MGEAAFGDQHQGGIDRRLFIEPGRGLART